jgi:hypothetical protein
MRNQRAMNAKFDHLGPIERGLRAVGPWNRLASPAAIRRRVRPPPHAGEGVGLSDLRLQEGFHAVPGEIGAGDIVGGAALVGEGVRGVIAIDFVPDASLSQHLF